MSAIWPLCGCVREFATTACAGVARAIKQKWLSTSRTRKQTIRHPRLLSPSWCIHLFSLPHKHSSFSASSISMCFHLSPPYCSHVHLELSKRARASSLGADGSVICALVHRRREGPRNDNKDLCAKCAVGVSLISWFLLRRRRSWRDNGKMDYFALGCWRWSIARGNLPNESRKGEIGKILTPSWLTKDLFLCSVMPIE
jgi:hypothetical protein